MHTQFGVAGILKVLLISHLDFIVQPYHDSSALLNLHTAAAHRGTTCRYHGSTHNGQCPKRYLVMTWPCVVIYEVIGGGGGLGCGGGRIMLV